MGASYWSNLVAHDDLVERAFGKLQADVFARREYHGDRPGSAFDSIEMVWKII